MRTSKIVMIALTAVAIVSVGQLLAEEAAKLDLSKVKCVVSNQAVDADATCKHNKGDVYFCCGKCKAAFEGEEGKKKFAAKANHQLLATKQIKQKGCPMSGKDIDPDTLIKVAGVEVGFCCGKCKKAAESKELKDQINLIFNEKAFKKAFELAKKED